MMCIHSASDRVLSHVDLISKLRIFTFTLYDTFLNTLVQSKWELILLDCISTQAWQM